MNYAIEELKQEDFDKWNEFVKENKLTIFHTIEWKKILESSFGFKPIYYIVKNENNEVVGVAPAFICRNFFKKAIVSMPFFEYGGPFVKEGYTESYKTIFNNYKELVDNGKIDFVKIRSLPLDISYGEIGFKKELEGYDYYMGLVDKEFEKDFWQGFRRDSNIRKNVRKAIDAGIIIQGKISDSDFYNLIIKKDARLGSPSFSKKLYRNLNKFLSNNVQYITCSLRKKFLFSLVSLDFNNVRLLHQIGSDLKSSKSIRTDIVYVEEIKDSLSKSYLELDFGRSRPNSSTAFFKEKFRCEKRNLYAYYYPADFSEDKYGGKEFGQKVIKKLPWLFTRTFLGNWLRKNVGL